MALHSVMRRYVVLGAGAIGCGVGGLLKLAGAEVVMVSRGSQLDVLRNEGLRLATPTGSHTLSLAACDARAMTLTADDVVLLCTKSQDSREALASLAVAGRPVVCLQNGVSNEPLVAELGGVAYGAMVFMPASFLVPGRVSIHSRCPGVIDVGRHPDGVDACIEQVADDLRRAGIDSRAVGDIMALKYGKLLSNLGNVLQAVAGTAALQSPTGEALRRATRHEAEAVLLAAGIAFVGVAELYRRCDAVTDDPVEGQARPGGSSWQSLARSRSLETDYLNGEIVRLGEEHKVATPLNAGLCALAERASREAWPPERLGIHEVAHALRFSG